MYYFCNVTFIELCILNFKEDKLKICLSLIIAVVISVTMTAWSSDNSVVTTDINFS